MGLVTSCCCGCTLAQGTIGVGILSLVRSLICFAVGGYYLQVANEDNLSSYLEAPEYSSVDKELVRTVLRATGWIFVVDGAIMLLVGVLLFAAVKTKRRSFLVPWLVVQAIWFLCAVPSIALRIINGVFPFYFVIASLLFFILMVYLYMVVVSYFKSLVPATAIPTGVIMDPYNQPGYVIHPPGAAQGATPLYHYPPMEAPVMSKDDPPMYPPAYAPPPSSAAYTPLYNPPPPYSQSSSLATAPAQTMPSPV